MGRGSTVFRRAAKDARLREPPARDAKARRAFRTAVVRFGLGTGAEGVAS